MSPWKVLGWLLVALLCLLLTAGAYGLALLWGWSLPSVWWLAAIAGAGAGVALIITGNEYGRAFRDVELEKQVLEEAYKIGLGTTTPKSHYSVSHYIYNFTMIKFNNF